MVGIDLSGAQIQDGRARVERLQLKNLELVQKDLVSVTKKFGQFDYILCHGVYSWVPEKVQQAILRICRENLSARGIAYIGYKTYPGWKAHEIVRDAMLLRAGEREGGAERLAYGRGMLDFLHQHARRDSVLARAIEQDHAMIRTFDAAYVIHDFLASTNAPCYFRDFAARADEHDLAYLADADPPLMFATNYGDEIARLLFDECGHSQVLLEQYLDFVTDRAFRRSLLVRKERAGDIGYNVQATRLRGLHVAAQLACAQGEARIDDSPQPFSAANGNAVVLDNAVAKLAAEALTRAWPFTMGFDELHRVVQSKLPETEQARNVTEGRLVAFFNSIVVQGIGRYRLTPLVRQGEHPCVDKAARDYPAYLPQGQAVHTFNGWHEPVLLNPVMHYLLPHLDGSHTREALLAMLARAVSEGTLTIEAAGAQATLAAELDRVLALLCA
ncbi:class I SAM-dependent methyltransferase [Paraburkholderia sp. LEh10]|uniref:class I SAM-dependent methyltransferase n=1 Tax=Paraburkholderia sp. LEh10 TaxID=2821353 RepID=UPI0028A6B664|nr:class I SAM-dependent methyltransferase [Paraburkholderia sp. LEh10]